MSLMKMVCLDLEWVLIPEIWEELSKATGIEEFMLTTRDISDYSELMSIRINKMKENSITLSNIKEIVWNSEPLPWAVEFMKWLRSKAQVTILTWSFYDYIMPLLQKLDYPCTFANFLEIENDMITWYKMRESDWKIEVIKRLHDSWFETVAIWDSYNDLKMIQEATTWIFFRPAPKLEAEMKDRFKITRSHQELKEFLEKIL